MSSNPADMSVQLWLTLKLAKPWSAPEVASLLRQDNIEGVVECFPQLETPIKIRTLLTFLSMSNEKRTSLNTSLSTLLHLAENDSDEWVQVGSGLVRRWLNGPIDKNDFLEEKFNATMKILISSQNESSSSSNDMTNTTMNYIPLEKSYLCRSLQPRPPLGMNDNPHFTVVEETKVVKISEGAPKHSSRASLLSHRSQMTRPVVNEKRRVTATLSASSSSKSSSFAARRDAGARRSLEMGRFQRKRSRISVIDLDEVKALNEEKARVEKERKKKLVTLEDSTIIDDSTVHKEQNILGNMALLPPPPMSVDPLSLFPPYQQPPIQYPPGFGVPPSYWS